MCEVTFGVRVLQEKSSGRRWRLAAAAVLSSKTSRVFVSVFVFVFMFVFVSAFVSVFVSVFVFVFVAEPCCSGSVLQNISLSDMFQFTPGPSIRVVKTLKAQQRFFVKCRLQNGPTICYRHQV